MKHRLETGRPTNVGPEEDRDLLEWYHVSVTYSMKERISGTSRVNKEGCLLGEKD